MAEKRNVFLTRKGIVAIVAGVLLPAALFVTTRDGWTPVQPGLAAAVWGEDAGWSAVHEAFEDIATAHLPAVVQLQLIRRDERRFGPDRLEDFFLPDEFRLGKGFTVEEQAVGSGIIVREDGYIVTARHLLRSTDEIHVILHDGTRLRADVVGSDALSGIAMLKIEASGLPVLTLDPETPVRTGQWIMAFGSPLATAFRNSAALGVISSHSVVMDSLEGALITDAALNPGNSGGPLINLRGQVVGMAVVPFSISTGFTGISQAIPVSVLRHVSDQLMAQGYAGRARLGVQYGPISEAFAAPEGAARIVRVEPGSAAEQAGVREGDVVLAVDGTKLGTHLELSERVAAGQPGDVVSLTIQRGTESLEMTIRLKEAALPAPTAGDDEDPQERLMREMGFTVDDITPDLVRDMQVPVDDGVVVLYVNPSSTAYREGDLRGGMVIVEMADQKIGNQLDFMRVYNEIPTGVTFLVMVHRPQLPGALLTALEKP